MIQIRTLARLCEGVSSRSQHLQRKLNEPTSHCITVEQSDFGRNENAVLSVIILTVSAVISFLFQFICVYKDNYSASCQDGATAEFGSAASHAQWNQSPSCYRVRNSLNLSVDHTSIDDGSAQ